MTKPKIHFQQLLKFCLYISTLNIRKVAEIEKEKKIIIDEFINNWHKSQFKSDNLKFSNKLKK